jgi:hypothetical protein
MQRRIDRRTFIKHSAAVTGGLALSLSATLPAIGRTPTLNSTTGLSGVNTMTWYGLDPEWGAGMPGCPITPEGAHAAGGNCHACSACHKHGDNKLFPSMATANANRAHLGCKCMVYEGGELPEDIWIGLFGEPDAIIRDQVDRRWDWVADLLSGESCDVDFAHPAIEKTWARTDKPVLDGDISRTWMWGPAPFSCSMTEDYTEAPGGKRLVQYFDKSRMEVTNPAGDQDSIWFVTNGLLVVELITGERQMGHNDFVEFAPAEVNVAGDADDANGPTYKSFAGVLDAAPLPLGSTIIQKIDRAGNVTSDSGLAAQNITAGHLDEITNHVVAAPFWAFMNSAGTVYENGGLTNANLFPEAVFATGRPISEAYWANVKVANTVQLVLMQCFERRCLTYTPGNDPAWRVEAGNVGQHYYAWRYGP